MPPVFAIHADVWMRYADSILENSTITVTESDITNHLFLLGDVFESVNFDGAKLGPWIMFMFTPDNASAIVTSENTFNIDLRKADSFQQVIANDKITILSNGRMENYSLELIRLDMVLRNAQFEYILDAKSENLIPLITARKERILHCSNSSMTEHTIRPDLLVRQIENDFNLIRQGYDKIKNVPKFTAKKMDIDIVELMLDSLAVRVAEKKFKNQKTPDNQMSYVKALEKRASQYKVCAEARAGSDDKEELCSYWKGIIKDSNKISELLISITGTTHDKIERITQHRLDAINLWRKASHAILELKKPSDAAIMTSGPGTFRATEAAKTATTDVAPRAEDNHGYDDHLLGPINIPSGNHPPAERISYI